MLVFGERRKSKQGKTSLSRVENQKTQPKYDAVWELNPGHTGGGQELSSLQQPCSLASNNYYYYMALSHEDWELQNSRIRLAKIDIDRGLDIPI